MATNKSPIFLISQLLSNFSLVTENYHFRFALNLFQKTIEQVSLTVVTNDEGRAVQQFFCIGVKILETPKADMVFVHFCLDIFKFGTIMICIDNVNCFGNCSLDEITSLYLS